MLLAELEARLGATQLDVALEVAPGECVALAGPSGAGKTSILRGVAGLLRPDRGRVLCGEETWLDTRRGVEMPAERRRVGYLFQDYALFPHLGAWRNVAYALPRAARRREHALQLLDRFGVAHLADERPRTLSGGERQRVALARALAREPAALLLDEPLSALDARTRAAATRELLAVLRGTGVPSLLVTHDFTEAALLGDRVAVIDAGRVVQTGTAAALAAEPASPFVAGFTGAVILTGTAAPGPDGLTVVELDGGGRISAADRAAGPVAVSVYPWEIALAPPGAVEPGSARNHLDVEVITLTPVGNRVRVGLAAPQPLTAELTTAALRGLGIARGGRAIATFKATATRLLPLS